MMHVRGFCVSAILSALVIAPGCAPAGPEGAGSGQVMMEGDGPPMYRVDAFWPKDLPNK